MILHLEEGGCQSGIQELDLNVSAAHFGQSTKFIRNGYMKDLMARCHTGLKYNKLVYPFYCCRCDMEFARLSALLQHLDSPRCDETLNDGEIPRLMRWLWRRHDLSGNKMKL